MSENMAKSIFTPFLISLAIVLSSSASALDIDKFVPGGKIIATFQGPDQWKIHVTENENGVRVNMWEDAYGIVVVGKVFSPSAEDLSKKAQLAYDTNAVKVSVVSDINATQEQLAEAAPETDATDLGVLLQLEQLPAENYTTVEVGSTSDKEMYVFYDYNCPYCATAKSGLENEIRLRAKIHWVPVAILHPNSAIYGAAVLDGEIELDSFAKGKPASYPEPSDASLEAIAHNTRLLKSMPGRVGTPTILYRTSDNRIVRKIGLQKNGATEFVAKFMEAT